MNSLTRISRRKLCHDLIIRLQSTIATMSTSTDINIPNKIERGPTDILKALESTISRDYTAPHYKYHDDPYLTPLSKYQNRTYAFAKESGKKAAMWIREEHRDLFQHKVADPEIQAFVPPPIYTEESKVTEETLLYEISNAHVANSITIYDLLKGEVTVPTKQALFELLCFHNNSEPINTELLEKHWYQHPSTKKRFKNMWINHPQIDVLFEFLKKQEPAVEAAAYTAMICGLSKYLNIEKAWHLYLECKQQKIPLSIDGYNAMISIVPMLKEEDDKMKKTIMDIYRAMAANGITPNIHTFNIALNAAATFKNNKTTLNFTHTVFADIAKFQLKPSLATYYYVLRILNTYGDAAYTTFMKILKILKKESLVIQDAKDLNFFSSAMEMASKQFCNRQAGEMINELLLTGDNYKFIGCNYEEHVYYHSYMELILATEDFETFFKLYNKLVPHVAIPESAFMKAILEALQLHPAQTATQYIPKLWSHMIMFGHANRQDLLENILHLMSVHCKPASDSPLNTQFAKITVAIWNCIQTQNTKAIQHVMVSNKTVGYILLLLLRGNNFDKAMKVLSSFITSPYLMMDNLMTEDINEIFELCLAQAHIPMIFTLLKYITSYNLEGAGKIAEKLNKTVSLTSDQKNMLTDLVGNDVLQLQLSDQN